MFNEKLGQMKMYQPNQFSGSMLLLLKWVQSCVERLFERLLEHLRYVHKSVKQRRLTYTDRNTH